MRVALIQLPQKASINSFIPESLLCLATFINQYGHQPFIVDLSLHFKTQKFPSDFFRQAAKIILRHRPQVLGFTVMCNTLPAALLIAKECKKLAPQVPIIFGGPEVSFEEAEVIKIFKQIDIIVRGEGEITFVQVLRALKEKKPPINILGITYREKNQIIKNPDRPFIKDLDKLPSADFSLLPHIENYHDGLIDAGRGCPFRCTFCSTCKMWKQTFRIKSPQRLARDLRKTHALLKRHKDSSISITHDHFLASRKVVKRFLSLISNQGISWSCFSRFEVLDEALIKRLKKAGCQLIYLGIESGSPKTQKEIKKNLPLERLPQVLELLGRHGIQAILSFIIGFPNENKHQLNQTLQMILRSKLYISSQTIQVHPFTFLKGSELHSKSKNCFKQTNLCQMDHSSSLTNLSPELSLIKKHPDVFPSFYYLKRKNISPRFLKDICIFFPLLINSFPLTALLLIRSFSISPLQLCKKIIAFYSKQKEEMKSLPPKGGLEAAVIFIFLRDMVKRRSSQLIKEVFLHETIVQKSASTKSNDLRSDQKIKPDSHPKLAANAVVNEYQYDIKSLTDILKSSTKRNIPRAKCYIAYVPGRPPRTILLNPSHYNLLLLCDGTRSIGEIIQQAPGHKKTTKKNATIKNLRLLQEHGIISVSS